MDGRSIHCDRVPRDRRRDGNRGAGHLEVAPDNDNDVDINNHFDINVHHHDLVDNDVDDRPLPACLRTSRHGDAHR